MKMYVVSFVEMDLEPVIQSKVSQKEKKILCYIVTYICDIQKNGTHEPICRAEIETWT